MPIKIKKPKCSRKSFEQKKCKNYQALSFNDDGNKIKTLYFNSVNDREKFYKKSLKNIIKSNAIQY